MKSAFENALKILFIYGYDRIEPITYALYWLFFIIRFKYHLVLVLCMIYIWVLIRRWKFLSIKLSEIYINITLLIYFIFYIFFIY